VRLRLTEAEAVKNSVGDFTFLNVSFTDFKEQAVRCSAVV
jgi:hypothetical protein